MTYVYSFGQPDELQQEAGDLEMQAGDDTNGVEYVTFLGENNLGTAADVLKTITGAISDTGLSVLEQSGTKLIFRSNVTPEIAIDIPTLLKGEQATQVNFLSNYGDAAVTTDSNQLTMKLIAPQISFQARNLGLRKSIAPYGTPTPNAWIMFLFVLAASGLIGAKIAWALCERIPPKS